MPKHASVSPEQVEWLRNNYKKLSYVQMAKEVGVCADTLKRILVRHGIAHFESAKFAVAMSAKVEMWTRPCMNCGDTTPRPKWKYICNKCKSAMDWEDND